MKKIIYLFLVLVCSSLLTYSQIIPKYEMRGVWMSPRSGDWPSAAGTSASDIASQKNQLVSIFDLHKSYGMNAIYFHVRPLGDAIYKSNIEPWSHYLVGTQGSAPSDPNYDPLSFAIQEAHKRGMELHAWLNPYRIIDQGGYPTTLAANNVARLHPEWTIKCSSTPYTFLDPALPEVREFLIKVIMDIVRRYDVDGIHFDDYFYPYADYGSFNDDKSFAKYKKNFTDRAAWRKNNVNILLSAINDSIKAVKPWIKFGVSPSGNPSVNNDIFCDAFGWLQGTYVDTAGVAQKTPSYIDYIMPQLYWVRYNNQLPSWSGVSTLNGRHLYVGLPAYRYTESGFTPYELGWEMTTNRATPTVNGGVYFSSRSLIDFNYAGCTDTLLHNYYVHSALTPKMAWLPGSNTKPNAPSNLKAEKNATTGKYDLKWDAPAKAQDGDTATVYVVYRFDSMPTQADLSNAAKIFGTNGETKLPASYGRYSATSGNFYVVTAVDRYSNESSMSNVLELSLPDQVPVAPALVSPADKDASQVTSAVLKWTSVSAPAAESYLVQVAKDSTFNTIVANAYEMKSTTYTFKGITTGQKYYWRVKSAGMGGSSQFSKAYSFESGIPLPPTLASPQHTAGEIPVNATLKWFKQDKATSYQVQVGTQSTMTSNIIFDSVVNDTMVTLTGLVNNKIYYWRVKSKNTLGISDWSAQWGFRTTATVDVKEEKEAPREYSLHQNYPNPFNPSTMIKYSLAKDGPVRVSVSDILGKEIAVLVDRNQNAGSHSVEFDAGRYNLTSGIYFYTLKTSGFISTKKMIIMK